MGYQALFHGYADNLEQGGNPIRILAISDIHGSYSEFNALLRKVNYRPLEDKLILMGDYVDRGPDSKRLVEQVMTMQREEGVIVLKGNHDKMACDALTNEDDKLDTHWLSNGGYHTLMSYCEADSDFLKEDFGWKDYMLLKEKSDMITDIIWIFSALCRFIMRRISIFLFTQELTL